MRTVTVSLTKELDEFIENLILKEVFPNKSEFIRTAVRELLLKHESFIDD